MRLRVFKWVALAALVSSVLVATVRADAEEGTAAAQEHKPIVSLDGLTDDETQNVLQNSETHNFQTEVNRMMKLIINSLYKNKEIFLRELISNSADALDKIRFLSLTNKESLGETSDLTIKIRADADKGILHITDTGVGMTKEQLVSNLGTIARSGTQEFMDALAKGDSNMLIGQFGVGFYSTFLVADTVVVTSKNNEDDSQWIWESDSNSFKVFKDPRGEEFQLGRGTTVSLHLKEESKDLLKESNLKDLVAKYSQFINFPIFLYTTKEVEVEVEDDEDKLPSEKEGDEDVEVETDKDKKKETRKEQVSDYEQLNTIKPLWTRSPKEVTDDEYNQFYKDAFKQLEDPVAHVHFDAEGEIAFKSLLYIPAHAPKDTADLSKIKSSLKLFVRRVFISEELDILPRWLAWLKGLLDSDDLPLNVSRETLQQSKLIKVMRKKIVRKAIEMMRKMAEDDVEKYNKFWREFGSFIKLGALEQDPNAAKLVKLMRWESSAHPKNLVGLEEYVARMKEGQKDIYYITGLSRKEVETSPLAESLLAQGYEVLYALDPMDEYVVQGSPEFEGHKFVNAGKEGLVIGDEKKNKKQAKKFNKEFSGLKDYLKTVLGAEVEDVGMSTRLEGSPCALVARSWGLTGTMQKVMRAQASQQGGNPMTEFYLSQKPILEINPRHPLIQRLKENVDAGNTEGLNEKVLLMFEAAVLRSGYDLKDAPAFAQRIERVLRSSLEIDQSAGVEPEAEIEDDDEEAEAEKAEDSDDEGIDVNMDDAPQDDIVDDVPEEAATEEAVNAAEAPEAEEEKRDEL